jgi:trigger factor
MKVTSQPLENSQVSLNVEMEAGEIDGYLDIAYNHLVGKVKVPGFRKGKTPRDVLERHIGKGALLDEALEHLIPEAYQKALAEQKIEPIARPEIEILQTEPVIFKATVPVVPTVKIGDYKAIRVESKPIEVSEKEAEATIQQLRQQHATLLPAERPAQMGDILTIDMEGASEGKPFPAQKALVYELTNEAILPLPGFAKKLEGAVKGEDKEFDLTFAADYEMTKLAGKSYQFKVKVSEIKEKKLPELNDEFAKTLGVETFESLKEQVLAGLKARAEEITQQDLEKKIIDAAVELSTVEFPPVLTEGEIDRLVEEGARGFNDGIKGLEEYLKSVNKTMEAHREELRPIASKRVIRMLVLGKVAEEEKIEVAPAEIDNEIEKMVKDADKQGEQLKQLFSIPQARRSIEEFLISRKTMERLKQIAAGAVQQVSKEA